MNPVPSVRGQISALVIFMSLSYLMAMNETEQAILATLLDLEDKVAQMKTANPKPNLLPVFDRLETLARQLPPGTDPELLHFLQKKSYEKARILLQGMEPPKGSCRK